MVSNAIKVASVKAALSHARMATFEKAAAVSAPDDLSALVLYAWNAEVSGVLLTPLHVCEVVIRNAVSDALEAVYGQLWPWSVTFEQSLPDPSQGYNPRKDLRSARNGKTTTGKVIPELKFVFWQKMFTRRYDVRLWHPHLRRVFPHGDASLAVPALRQSIYGDLERLRALRNRIAHHEPIFARALADDLKTIIDLVTLRCTVTASTIRRRRR